MKLAKQLRFARLSTSSQKPTHERVYLKRLFWRCQALFDDYHRFFVSAEIAETRECSGCAAYPVPAGMPRMG